jgi:hypothetical protein
MAEFDNELNLKNNLIIQELDKQVDELSLIPLKDLDPFENVH